jgi:hypothetical protein
MMCDFLSFVEPWSGSPATSVRLPKRLMTFAHSLSRDLGQISDTDQVVGGGSELEDPADQSHSAVSGFTQQSHGLQPTKDFFHSLAFSLTNFITRVARGSLVALLRPLLFWATCGVTWQARKSATKSFVS